MIDIKQNEPERTLLVGMEFSRHVSSWNKDRVPIEESMEELKELTQTAGAQVVFQSISKRDKPTAPLFIGKGKAEELAHLIEKEGIQLVVFDDDLAPAQQKQLQEIFKVKVIDRTGLILDIFAQRAHSREGKLEVELAQMLYLLPRLTRMWTHLSRQNGGIGTRGPGETQLEVDRRRVRERISRLKIHLEEVRQNRATQRKKRERFQYPAVALVGYTNAGKSTLLNALTDSKILADDKLFATLDPTSRKLILPNQQSIILSDTVGFIRKLPHHLIESFKATLEEVGFADLLIHLLDVSHPQAEDHYKVVCKTLDELKVSDKPTLLVLNKIDQLENQMQVEWWKNEVPRCVALSATKKVGFSDLLHEIEQALKSSRQKITLKIPQSRGDLLSQIYREGKVIKVKYHGDMVNLTAEVPAYLFNHLKEYQ